MDSGTRRKHMLRTYAGLVKAALVIGAVLFLVFAQSPRLSNRYTHEVHSDCVSAIASAANSLNCRNL